MNLASIASIVVFILTNIPKLISVGSEILKLLPKFKEGGLASDVQVIGEILKLILGLAPTDKSLASLNMVELKNKMRAQDKDGLVNQRDALRVRKAMFN